MRRLRRIADPEGCAAVSGRRAAYVLHDLPPREERVVARHLARCERCRQAVRRERELLALVPLSLEPVQPPGRILEGVVRRIQLSSRRRSGVRGAVALAAVVGLVALVGVLALTPRARSLAGALASPHVAVINLFVALDSPLTARYEYRTARHLEFDQSVGRILYDLRDGEWRLAVHGLPRPPHGARYVLTALVDGKEVELGRIERWEDGVASLEGRTDLALTRTERLSLQLVSPRSRLRLLDSVEGAW